MTLQDPTTAAVPAPALPLALEPPTDRLGRRRRPSTAERPHGARWWREVGWRHAVGLVAVAFAVFPALYIVSAAFNPLGTVASTGLIPSHVSLDNFRKLLDNPNRPFLRWYLNTLVLATVISALQVMFSAFAAYAFSRFRFAGRRGGLLSVLLIQMFPQFLAVIALFAMFSRIGDVLPGIGLSTVPGYALILLGGSLGQVWLIKGFFDSVPRELDEAAIIDGCSPSSVFFRILLPLIVPILAVTGLLTFVGVVNEFIIGNIFLTASESKTLAVGLFGIIDGDKSNNLGVFAAGALLTALPIVILFQFLQRFIVGGLTAGAVKG